MFNKKPTKVQTEIIKKKWIQNEYGYKTLIEIVRYFIMRVHFKVLKKICSIFMN